MNDLTGFQRDLLYVAEKSSGQEWEVHGLAIKKELQTYYETEVHHGRLYPNLDSLVRKGLIEKGTIDKRTNSYTITDRGRRELAARRDWEAQPFGEGRQGEATETDQEQDQEHDQDDDGEMARPSA
jgi:PadR family transcriptional regulator PadR